MKYIRPSPSSPYFIREVRYSCDDCGEVFIVRYPVHDDLVKYIDPTSGEERWLPVGGDLGYLDLLERLVVGFSKDDQVSMATSRQFESAFKDI